MLPIVVQAGFSRIGVAGRGDGLARRVALLADAGIVPSTVFETALPTENDIAALKILFVAGLDEREGEDLARIARRLGVLVNVEDVPAFCDFHVPASVRRGDLLLTVSTGGRAPGLSRILREALEKYFAPEWSDRLNTLSVQRGRWRNDGLAPAAVAARTREFVQGEGWLS